MPSVRKIIIYIIVFALIPALILMFLYNHGDKVARVITPFFMAVAVAYLVNPLVLRLENRKIPRKYGILLIYLGFSAVAAAAVAFIIPEIISNAKELMNTLPDIVSGYQGMLNGFISDVRSSRWSGEIKNVLSDEISNIGNIARNYITDFLKRTAMSLVKTAALLFDVLLAMVIAYYFLKDAEFFKSLALSLVPGRWRNNLINMGREINAVLSNFIQGQLLVAMIVAVLEIIGLSIVRVKYPLILGLIGGASNVIPYFGPYLGAVPAVAVALIESPLKALWTAAVFVVVQQIDNSFISPRVIEGKLGLHPVTTIFSVLAGGQFFGVPGMLVSVPVMAILKVVAKRIIKAIV